MGIHAGNFGGYAAGGGRRKAAKGFNWICAKLLSLCADSRFAEPRYSLQRERVVTFCIVQKVTKKHARTCKKLPVASFCASETAETGRIANGREQGDHVSRRRLRPATSIQSSAGKNFAKISGGTCRNRFCPQNTGEKALNRCKRVTVVQTQDCKVSKKGCFAASSQ